MWQVKGVGGQGDCRVSVVVLLMGPLTLAVSNTGRLMATWMSCLLKLAYFGSQKHTGYAFESQSLQV